MPQRLHMLLPYCRTSKCPCTKLPLEVVEDEDDEDEGDDDDDDDDEDDDGKPAIAAKKSSFVSGRSAAVSGSVITSCSPSTTTFTSYCVLRGADQAPLFHTPVPEAACGSHVASVDQLPQELLPFDR